MTRPLSVDALVVGGGATGAGLLRDLARRGLHALLVEKGDLGSGTSGRYHGLLHSGGRYVVVARKHAATNPNAWFYQRPITLEDHQNSRWIVEPLHLLDCCLETDNATALIVTSAERARDLRRKPVYIMGVAGRVSRTASDSRRPGTAGSGN